LDIPLVFYGTYPSANFNKEEVVTVVTIIAEIKAVKVF
jgi:hypothetical protein